MKLVKRKRCKVHKIAPHTHWSLRITQGQSIGWGSWYCVKCNKKMFGIGVKFYDIVPIKLLIIANDESRLG